MFEIMIVNCIQNIKRNNEKLSKIKFDLSSSLIYQCLRKRESTVQRK